MKALQLPGRLTASLIELGLLESEAKIYAALVLLGYADVGDLLEILDVSKPRIYTSLGTLEEKGLIVQTSPRPAIYQAIAPHIALEMITKKYEKAKNAALEEFKIAEKQELVDKPSPPLCCIFGDKNSEFKIRDMLENARKSVYCRTSEKYLGYIKKFVKNGIKLRLIIMSDTERPQKQMENLFKTGDVYIRTISIDRIMEMTDPAEEEAQRKMSSMVEMPDLDDLFLLVADDAEALMVIPIKSGSLNAITSTNKTVVYMMERWIELNDIAKNQPIDH